MHQYELFKQCAIRLIQRMSEDTTKVESSVTFNTGHTLETLFVTVKPYEQHFYITYERQIASPFLKSPRRDILTFILNPESGFVEAYTKGPAYGYAPDLEDRLNQL